MMRYLEWLFPVHRYIRRPREVGVVRPVLTVLAILGVIGLLPLLRMALQVVDHLSGAPAPVIARAVLDAIAWCFRDPYARGDLITWGASWLVGTACVLALEFAIAVTFVRTRPGRRRPLCVWQTAKYVLLSLQSWLLAGLVLFGLLFGVGWAAAAGGLQADEDRWMAVVLVIATIATATPLLLGGALAVQAARAVIVLQDDRRCEKCGYFLFRLVSPRCPECGTPFDPAKLGRLSLADSAQGEQLPAEAF